MEELLGGAGIVGVFVGLFFFILWIMMIVKFFEIAKNTEAIKQELKGNKKSVEDIQRWLSAIHTVLKPEVKEMEKGKIE
ncbi:hypothetical protein KAH81_04560 [bacterium]|nr:hypothetical protein [bacterium]